MKLSEIAHGKNNNFNLIRMLAALAVLFTHSFALSTGSSAAEPLRTTLGLTWGDIAVNIFFVTSGFLVTASLLTRNNAIDFVWARVLRIYPALWFMLSLTVFGLGAFFTAYQFNVYFGDRITWHYLLKNAILISGVHYELPGVFQDTPTKGAVNGSLWTLVPEVRVYALLLAVWIAASFVRCHRLAALRLSIIAIVAISGAWYLYHGLFEPRGSFPRLTFMFFTGARLYVLRDKMELSRPLFWLLLATLWLSLISRTTFFFVFNAILGYILMYAAYAFGGSIRAFNRLGDYSYGVYIYAFPVQQSLVALVHEISVPELMVCSATITLALAVLSWHLVEKRALGLKTVCADRTKYWIHSWRG